MEIALGYIILTASTAILTGVILLIVNSISKKRRRVWGTVNPPIYPDKFIQVITDRVGHPGTPRQFDLG